MRLFHDQTKDSLCAFRAHAVVCLIMLQAIAFLFAPLGRSHVPSDIPGVSLAVAGAICGNDGVDGDRTHSTHEHECMICANSGRDHWNDALAVLAVVVIVLSPDAEESSAAYVAHDSPSPPSCRFRLSLSRGPPTSFA
jgi:hypothetical protein